MVEAALRRHDGIPVLAAKALKTSPQNIRQRINATPRLQAAVAEIDVNTLDVARGVITEALHDSDRTTARWYLERKGKELGFGNSSTTSLAENDLAALAAAFGGDVERLRAARKFVEEAQPPEE